jgi:murein DD-endopeptidase MepM/ murein hydrolase activator NlpD
VRAGDRVKRSELLGAVGSTGRSTGPHLHYEVRVNGVPQNPRKFLLEE